MPEARCDVFQATADPTRRAILALLAVGTLAPNAIAAEFDSSRKAVSKHLALLSECGLVKSKASGREVCYKLNFKKLKDVERWLAPFRGLWEDRFNQLVTLSKTSKNKRSSPTQTPSRSPARRLAASQ